VENNSVEQYLGDRLTKALAFYDERAGMYKRWYRRLSSYVIVISAALTAFVALVPPETGWRIASTALSASIVVATGLLAHYKCHENWLSYRATWDALIREREFFTARVKEYKSSEDANALFVERIESILSKEASDFYTRHVKAEEPQTPNTNKG
jgi:hypothetical protein